MKSMLWLTSVLLSATLSASPDLLAATAANTKPVKAIPAVTNASTAKGQLVIVGGALSSSNQQVYQKFIELAGGADQARIAVVPVASGQPVKYFRQFQADLQRYGVTPQRVVLLPIAVKDDKLTADVDESKWQQGGQNVELAADLQKFSGIWFLGGDQTYITSTLQPDGQPGVVLQAIWQRYQQGAVLGGTSAGAAIMSEVMIAGGDSWGALTGSAGSVYQGLADQEQGPLQIQHGIGFFPAGIIDQHFDRKARFGRLIVATEQNRQRFPLGFGVDEDSALVFNPQLNQFSAIGNGAVTVVDVRNATRLRNPVGFQMNNIRLSILQGGDRYDLSNHQLLPQPDKLATVGDEYGAVVNPVNSGVFSRNTRLKDFITFDLIDNKATDTAISYLHQGPGLGFELKFSKDQYSKGYWQYLDGLKDNSSAANIRLDIKPVQISIQ
ncbi:MAG: cyanophycinase [Gammaproteobacteria bacterium]|nr:cyanophycinase [Gammaproteobacteria bacterium]